MFSLSGIADHLRKSSFLFNNKLRNTETDVLLFLKIQGLMLLRIILHLSVIAQFFVREKGCVPQMFAIHEKYMQRSIRHLSKIEQPELGDRI